MRACHNDARVQLQIVDRHYASLTHRWPHQDDAFQHTIALPEAALFLKPGLGKTKLTLDTAGTWWQQGKIDTVVVIAPNGVHRGWIEKEAPKHWAPRAGTMRWAGAAWRAGMRAKERERFDAVVHSTPPDRLVLVAFNTDAVRGGAGFDVIQELVLRKGPSMLFIVDESQKFKNPQAQRTKHLLKLRNQVAYKRLLSGTPLGTGYENLFAPFFFLDEDLIGVRTYTEFKAWFCIERRYDRFSKIIGYRQIERLMKLIAPITVFMDYGALTLPPRIESERVIELSEEQRRVYTALRDEYLVEMESGVVITATLAITRLQRLQQILSGFLPREDGTVEVFPNPRLDALLDDLETRRDAKTVVWCRWRHDVRSIAEALAKQGIAYARYYGALKQTECDVELDRFVSDKMCNVLLVTPSKGAEGLNDMVVAQHEIWYTHTFSFIQYEQGTKRVHRPGQTNTVYSVRYVASGTVDTRIKRLHEGHLSMADSMKDAVQGFRAALLEDADAL